MPCKSDHILVESSLDNASEGAGIKRTVATSEVNGIDWITKLKSELLLSLPELTCRLLRYLGPPTAKIRPEDTAAHRPSHPVLRHCNRRRRVFRG